MMLIGGRGPLAGLREQLEAEAEHREGADLVDDRRDEHGDRGGGLLHGVGQPGVQRPQRRLHREGEEETEEQPAFGVRRHVERAARAGLGDLLEAEVPGDHIEADHRGQHDQTADQVVEQELHGRVRPLRGGHLLAVLVGTVPEAADEEVHRDEHGFEEDVEEKDVGGLEGEDHHRLDGQDQGEEALRRPPAAAPRLQGVGVVPARALACASNQARHSASAAVQA